MDTVLLVLLAIAGFSLAGYAPAALLIDRAAGVPRLAALPPAGIAAFLTLAHALAALGLTGRAIAYIAPAVFGVLALAVPRRRRITTREAVGSLWPLALCLAALLIAAWPLFLEGHASYLSWGNPDAAFNLGAFDDLVDHRYGATPPDAPRYWPDAKFGQVFGAGYACVALAVLTGADLLALHDVVAAALLFAVPASVFLFACLGLNARRGPALAGAALAAAGSQLSLTFYLQSIGAMTFLALLPALLSAWAAAHASGGRRLLLLAALLFAGAAYGYYAATPVMLALMAVPPAVSLARRRTRIPAALLGAAAALGVFVASNPSLAAAMLGRSLFEAASSRLQAGLAAPELRLSFGFTLTEQYLPFFWGLSNPVHASDSLFDPPAPGFGLLLIASMALFAALVVVLARRGSLPLPARIQILLLLAAIAWFVFRQNAYGAFKLAAWATPLILPAIVCGAAGLRRRWIGVAILLLAALNLRLALRLGAASLPAAMTGGMPGFTGRDFDELRDAADKLRPARLLVAIPDPVVQRWALTYLRRHMVSVIPFLSLSPDEPEGAAEPAARGAESAGYVLTWAGRDNDIVSYDGLDPVWSNRKFQLLARQRTRDLLVVGPGWYQPERAADAASTGRRLRWLRSSGELLVLNGAQAPSRLRLTLYSPQGSAGTRRLKLLLNGRAFDEFTVRGAGSVLSKPFAAEGFLTRIGLVLSDTAEPAPRSWGLYNRWVPAQARRLSLAVTRIALVPAAGGMLSDSGCGWDLSQPGGPPLGMADGVFADRWVEPAAAVSLRGCANAAALSLAGFVPGVPAPWQPFDLAVSVNGRQLDPVRIARAGDFEATLRLPEPVRRLDSHDIRLKASRSFVPAELGTSPDRRRLSFRLSRIELSRSPGDRR